MRTVRTCSHIKTNGLKCGSPALRHQTLCYFHYQWDRRERRRVRLGGPVGTNKNTGIDLPILEGPESIMIALMEVQHALLDARIDRLTAHTLLYSLQLAMQLKIGSRTGLAATTDSVLACPELESELDLDRARGLRPSAAVCSTCEDLDTCINPKHCHQSPAAPFKLRRSAGVGPAAEIPRNEGPTAVGLSGVAPDDTTNRDPTSSRPERAAVARGAEGPASSPTTPNVSSCTPTLRESSPARECGVKVDKINASRANARRQISPHLPSRRARLLNSAHAKTPDSRPGLPSRNNADDNPAVVATGILKLETISIF